MEPLTAAQHFGRIVRRRRHEAEWSQETLAESADCHPTYVSMVERGKCNPSLEKLLAIAWALCCPAWKLLQEAERELRKQQAAAPVDPQRETR